MNILNFLKPFKVRLPSRYKLPTRYKSLKSFIKDILKLFRKGKTEGTNRDKEKDFYWDFIYKFPDTIRSNVAPNGVYGSGTETYDEIYRELVKKNKGEDFIKVYFDKVLPLKPVYEIILKTLDGVLDKGSIEAFENNQGEYIANLVKDDLENSLLMGEIPLKFTLSKRTKKARASVGLSPTPEFYATGRLIKNIQIRAVLRVKEHER